jgi:Leucine-rich repeat (LRR) protein
MTCGVTTACGPNGATWISGSTTAQPQVGTQCCDTTTSGMCSGNPTCDASFDNCQNCGGTFGPWAPFQVPVVQDTGTCTVQGFSPQGASCNASEQVCTACFGTFTPFNVGGQNMCCSTDQGTSCNMSLSAQCNQDGMFCATQNCQFGAFIPVPSIPFDASRVDISSARYQQLAAVIAPALLLSNPAGALLQDPQSAQARSLHWVANLDPVQVRSSDTTNLNARFALASLYYSTEGQFWSNSVGWLSSANHCNWFGVSCDSITNNPQNPGNIVSLDLENNNLVGNIPEELFSGLGSKLVDLELPNNKLKGTIPSLTLPSMSVLETLSLYNNVISGAIPDTIGNLPNLRRVYLENNLLTNRIPESIGSLNRLERLDVFNNRLYGSIPTEFGNLANLQRLWLSNNSFWGNLPQELGNMVALQELYLDENLFNGNLPSSLGNLNNLRDFRCYTNNFQGSIPTTLGQLVNLEIMYMDNNRLGGGIPQNFGNLFKLRELSLFNNTLDGQIPPGLGSLTQLEVMSLSFNKLSGPIPSTLNQLASLRKYILCWSCQMHTYRVFDSFDLLRVCSSN